MKTYEKALAARMLKEYAKELGNRSCHDWNFPEDWSEDQRKEFSKAVNDRFGRENLMMFGLFDTDVAAYLADALLTHAAGDSIV